MECGICHDQTTRFLPCGHSFCVNCVVAHVFYSKGTCCPLCRAPHPQNDALIESLCDGLVLDLLETVNATDARAIENELKTKGGHLHPFARVDLAYEYGKRLQERCKEGEKKRTSRFKLFLSRGFKSFRTRDDCEQEERRELRELALDSEFAVFQYAQSRRGEH